MAICLLAAYDDRTFGEAKKLFALNGVLSSVWSRVAANALDHIPYLPSNRPPVQPAAPRYHWLGADADA